MLKRLNRIPYSPIYLALVIGLTAISYLWPSPEAVPASSELGNPATATIDIVKSMITLATTLNTTMLAAAGALVVKGKDWTERWTRIDGVILLCTFVAGALSYYGVYAAYVALLEMVDAGVIGAMAPRLQTGLATQYYATLGGFVLLGLAFTRMLEGRIANTP